MDDIAISGAVKAIKNRKKNKPFFMFLGLNLPHPPYRVEKKYYDLIDKSKLPKRIPTIADTDDKPKMEVGLRDNLGLKNWSEDRFDELRAVYLAMVSRVDDCTKTIIDALKNEGIYDDTLIIFFSDHGDYTGDFGLTEKCQNAFPDCLARVPFILKPSKNLKVSTGINDNQIELIDLCATISEITQIPIDRWQFGKSLIPTLTDKNTPHREYVFSEGGRLIGETHCMEYDEKTHNPMGHYAKRMELQALEDGTHSKAVMIRSKDFKLVKRLYERDEFYDFKIGENVNQIDNLSYKNQISVMNEKLLLWYLETADSVPKHMDSRQCVEFIRNGLVTMGIPILLSNFLAKIIRIFLKITKKSPSKFLSNLARKHHK
jgi:arylsulfatase A-like enzyme